MKSSRILCFALLLFHLGLFSQKKAKDSIEDKPARPAFESSFIIDNPSNVLFRKNTLEVQMSHRFGLINGGTNDMLGFWGPSNIRMGIAYSIHDRVTLGFGTTKFDRLQDFNWKVGLLNQTRSDRIPVSVSYYGNFTIDARRRENFIVDQHRYSYFNQIIIARRFNSKLSMQLTSSLSHFNLVQDGMKNDLFAASFGGRYKISDQTSIMWDYSQPFTSSWREDLRSEPTFSFGFEIATSAHAFTLFISNANGIVPQQNYMKNTNDFWGGDILFGFNITRNYNF
ncbi:hypothetical protein FGF1_11370 [Flavobacteriaceae bacterium GF1]